MKKSLLFIGILIIIIGIIALLIGALCYYIKTNTLDGSMSFYEKQKKMMLIHLILGSVMVIGGIAILII